MFHQLPKSRAQAEEFFISYKKNVLARLKNDALDNSKNLSKCIQDGVSNLLCELNEKKMKLQETGVSIVEAKKKRKILTQRIKEASLKDREDLERKLKEIDNVCEGLEIERKQMVMRLEEKKMEKRHGKITDQIEALKVAKSLFSSFMQLSMSPTNCNHRVLLKFPYRQSQQTLHILFDTSTMTVYEPQLEVKEFARGLEQDGNIALFLVKIWKYLRAKEKTRLD
ncbi:uncharacterized protein LOC132195114 [Neocloeon triangulifer]|uniref:uncharacterized protein LOC132195114 n=1 Tax=Neocloeon triangulifer TaxID=2078957 RepID=UPI00286EC7F2|nr:uncharacterized protein LOC132195114 [Neocloeon triangulifer]